MQRWLGGLGAPDLVPRAVTATAPNQLWAADITCAPTWAGFMCPAIVLDAYSWRIVGWAMGLHLRTDLVLDALNVSVTPRRPGGVIHHTDHGWSVHGARLRATVLRDRRPPLDGHGGRLPRRCDGGELHRHPGMRAVDSQSIHSPTEARPAIFQFIEGWYNPHRRHSAPGQRSPLALERLMSAAA